MKNIIKIIATVLILCIFVGIQTGCSISKKIKDDNTLTLTMMSSSVPQILGALREKFPDIKFIVNEYAGCNFSCYQKEQLVRGEAGDIFFYTTFYNSNDASTYLVDLSGYPFLANYDKAILSFLDVEGAIYQIPGPITVRYIAVNKTLFEEKGWKIPTNFDEMVAVCKQIRKEAPEIAPLGLGMTSMGYIFTPVTSYAQMGYLDTTEGKITEQNYRLGTASFGDAFGEGLDMVCELIDAGAFMPEKFTNNWDVSPKQMGDREAAMCYIMGSSALHTQLFSGQAKGNPDYGEHSDDDFVVLPLFGRNAKNKGLILGASNTWGISKYLEEKGNEKKLKNALRVLEYVSSEEGQLAIRSNPAAIPAIKDLKSDDVPEFMRNLWNDSTNSIKSFFIYTGYEHMIIDTAKLLSDAMYTGSTKGLKEEFIRIADQANYEFLHQQTLSSSYGHLEDNFSVEDTRRVSCEAFRATAETEIAIASEGGIKNGISNNNGLAGKLFKGDILNESLTIIVANKNTNVVSVFMTGKEIREMLENGKVIMNADDVTEAFTYWASGANVSRKNGRVTGIKLNGKTLDDTSTYKVAMLNGDYSEEFANSHEITDTGVNILDALGSYFKSKGTIKIEK